jgi:hypothetical protein
VAKLQIEKRRAEKNNHDPYNLRPIKWQIRHKHLTSLSR